MVRDGVCCLSSDEFFRDDVLALIFNLSVSRFLSYFFLNFVCIRVLLCVCVCTLSTIYNNINNNKLVLCQMNRYKQ